MRKTVVKARHLLLLGVSLSCFSCDEGLRAEQTGTVQLSAPSFVIPKKVPGETAEQSIDVRNVGTGILRIINIDGQFGTEYDLYWTRADEEQQRRGIEDGQSYFPDAIDIAPEEQITLHLVYLARERACHAVESCSRQTTAAIGIWPYPSSVPSPARS